MGEEHTFSVVNVALVRETRPTSKLPHTKKEKRGMKASVRDRESEAGCEVGDQQAQTESERIVKRIKGRARNGVGEDNEAHVHITGSTALTLFVRFGTEVQMEGVRNW